MVHVIEATELKACKPNGKCFFHSRDVVTAPLSADDSSAHRIMDAFKVMFPVPLTWLWANVPPTVPH